MVISEKEEREKLKTRGRCGNNYDGIEWIVVNGEWIGKGNRYKNRKKRRQSSVENHLLVYIAKGLVLLSLMMIAFRIIVAFAKNTVSVGSGNDIDISAVTFIEDEPVSANSSDEESITIYSSDGAHGSNVGRKRKNRNIRTPYRESDDEMDEEWVDWY